MDHLRVSMIAELTLVDEGAMVTFSDGLCAIYPPAVLHACLSMAKVVTERRCEEAKAEIVAEHGVKCSEPHNRPAM